MDSPNLHAKQRESVDIAPLFLAEHNRRSNTVKKQKLNQEPKTGLVCWPEACTISRSLLRSGLSPSTYTSPS